MPRKPEPYADEDCGWAVVVALDPGGTTGWSVLCVEADALSDPDVSVLKSIVHFAQGELVGDENKQVRSIIELLAVWPTAAVVIEDFLLRKFSAGREMLSPVRITAAVEYVLSQGLQDVGRGRRVWKQMPAMAKKTATDQRLKDWRLYISEGGLEHGRDATRHAITFMRRASDRPRLRSEAWAGLYSPDGNLLQ